MKKNIMKKIKEFFENKKKIAVLAALIIVLGIIGWRVLQKKKQAVQYQTAQAKKGTLVMSISASGQVSSANHVSISTQASGVITRVFVQNGQKVKTGDKIAELELDLDGKLRASQAWSNYQSAKNNLEAAKYTLYTLNSAMWAANRRFVTGACSRGLTVDDPTYIQEHDDWLAAEAKYINQKNVVSQLQTALNSAWLSYQQVSPIIYAPISGTVTGLYLQKGMVLVAKSTTSGAASLQEIASIKIDAPVQLSVNLTEIDVTKVKIGDKATIVLDAFSDKTYTGKVISINTIGSVSSGVTSYPAVISLDAEAPEILPNMAVTAKIITDVVNEVILVPSAAIQIINEQSTVRVLKNGQISQVSVETGKSNDTQTVIISGINEGDTVIVGTISPATSRQSTGISPFGGGGMFRMGR